MAYAVALALAAAVAFGVTTPLVQHFGRDMGPFWTAALLYAGAAAASIPRGKKGREARLSRADAPRLGLVALFGAFVAPVALAWGLHRTSGTSAALMLNLEAGLTVVFGKVFFDEHIGRRVGVAAALIALGGAVLIADRGGAGGASLGLVAVGVATIGWALDNALSRPLADRDPGAVVFAKGALGAVLSSAIALVAHDATPRVTSGAKLALCGAIGFGLSLRMYLLAQRRMGAARTASVFAVAPFVGALVAAAMGERWSPALGAAAILMAIGVFFHATEKHAHWHEHEPTFHDHAHRHDDGHHDHHHDPMPEGEHAHPHSHERKAHAHAHGEDLHHRHH